MMWRVSRQYLRSIDRALAPLGITHLKFHALTLIAWLAKTEQAITQARLSEFSDIQPMQVSLIVRGLEEAGLITRVRATTDTRTKLVELTADGWQTLREALPIAVEQQNAFFGGVADPDGDLLRLLSKLDTHAAQDEPSHRPRRRSRSES
jgi:DNA-binding MarR family transcriptional regulator